MSGSPTVICRRTVATPALASFGPVASVTLKVIEAGPRNPGLGANRRVVSPVTTGEPSLCSAHAVSGEMIVTGLPEGATTRSPTFQRTACPTRVVCVGRSGRRVGDCRFEASVSRAGTRTKPDAVCPVSGTVSV